MPSWLSKWRNGKESPCQCRRWKRCRFNPWVNKIPWRRKWQPAPVFLPEESHGQRSLEGCRPGAHTHIEKELNMKYFSIYSNDFFFFYFSGLPWWLSGKESSCQCRRQFPSLGGDNPLEKEMAAHCSILAWKIPWTAEPGGLLSMGLQRVRHDWTTSLH